MFLRQVLIALLCLAALAGCAARQAKQEREARAPLREVFPPPSLEAPPATASANPAAPAVAAGSAAVAGVAASGVDTAAPTGNTASLKAPAPSIEVPAELRTPPASSEPGAARLEAPSLPDAPSGAEAPPATDSGQNIDLAKEFEAIPAAGAAAAAEPAPSAAAPPAAASAPARPAAQPAGPAAVSAPAVPKILVSNRPALLVAIQGPPTYGPVEGTKLQRVLNTPAFLVKGASGNLYLSVYDGFMTATRLAGPWTVLQSPPKVVQQAKVRAMQEGEADLLAGRPDSAGKRLTLKQAPPPRIIVSTQPAALVVIRGDPVYEPIEGTTLSRVTNTDSRLYVNRPEDRSYLKVADRWYRAKSLKGPWEVVDPAALPEGLEEAALTKQG
jgi:hypothetical protein